MKKYQVFEAIDKNAFSQLFLEKCVENCYICDYRNCEDGTCKLVNEAQTIEVVPKDFYERFADIQAKEIIRLSVELAAAKKVLQRFSFDNTRKCRYCKFGVKTAWNDWACTHPSKYHLNFPLKFPYYPHCTAFEYEYKEANNA